MTDQIKQVILIIMDGWGYASSWGGNAVFEANIPNFNQLWKKYPHLLLNASGKWVGLPGNERGNSEVGHLNIGAGKIVLQDVSFINDQLARENLAQNKVLMNLIEYAKINNSRIHLTGLVSDGGIHSHISHLYALLEYFSGYPELTDRIFIHGFTDGRDTPMRQALQLFSDLQKKMTQLKVGRVATICGRYFAMDRDNHWDRIQMAYDAMTSGVGRKAATALAGISQAYANGETDEFIKPIIITDDAENPVGTIKDNDVVIYFNFRSDRARELTLALASKEFNSFKRKNIIDNLLFVNLVPYGIEKNDDSLKIESLFHPEGIRGCLAEVLSENHKTQLHIAETEKYAHVTYFFNGGVETPYPGEDRILVPSPKVPTYNLKPEMSANEVTDLLLKQIQKKDYNFIVVNYANGDMVGHTGNYNAAIVACETVDKQLGRILSSVDLTQTAIIITADHGNAEEMLNPRTGELDTEHTANPVPCILVCPKTIPINSLNPDMKLANIAPTVLKLLNVAIPKEMDQVLFK